MTSRLKSTSNRSACSIVVACIFLVCSCSGGSDTAPTNPGPPPVASVSLDRTTTSITQGATTTLIATTRDADGGTLTGRSISWSTDAAGVATVSQSGVVTGVSVGSTIIRATSEGKQATAQVTVTPIPVNSVVLNTNNIELTVGQTSTFTAETRAADGEVLTGRNITWSAADATVVSIANGVVTALAPGNTTISATSEGKVATANVKVNAPSCASTTATGRLTGPTAGEYTYTTVAGWVVRIDRSRMRIGSPNVMQTNHYELWSSISENVGGKHIKNILGDRRTILLPGAVIITVSVIQQLPDNRVNPMDWVQSISIYEGNESHRIDMQTFAVTRSCALPMFGEADEHDGEAASIFFNETGMRMENVYQQDATTAGVPLQKIFNTVPLAQTYLNQLNRVDDFFDDTRLGHTW